MPSAERFNVASKTVDFLWRLWCTGLVKQPSGRMHVDDASRQYTGKNGEQHVTRCFLLRRSYRDENGKPQKETLANISDLPDNAISGLRLLLRGATLVDVESSFNVERSVPHGDVAAAHIMAGNSCCGPCSARRAGKGILLTLLSCLARYGRSRNCRPSDGGRRAIPRWQPTSESPPFPPMTFMRLWTGC